MRLQLVVIGPLDSVTGLDGDLLGPISLDGAAYPHLTLCGDGVQGEPDQGPHHCEHHESLHTTDFRASKSSVVVTGPSNRALIVASLSITKVHGSVGRCHRFIGSVNCLEDISPALRSV